MQTVAALEEVAKLPISQHLEALGAGIREHTLSIVQAPPGSGKTTVLPIFLAQQAWLSGKKVLVLQPRRLATTAVATRMAELLGESVGRTVGYHIRLERKVSAETLVEVITEGILTRRLIADPALSDVGVVIFDEFHERSVHADVGLALACESATALRDDLRIVVMSATLQSLASGGIFADAWRYQFDTSPYPVDIRFVLPEPRRTVWEEVARVVRGALGAHPGDLLAFLPGAYDIQRCKELLVETLRDTDILPLYGELPYREQQSAIQPNRSGRRRVVLATPIAETSLTIEGVRIVVDSGFHKVARSDVTGSTELVTERISLDAAEQRAGRAGRTAPGVCLRLWSQQDHATLRPSREPEILRIDLSQTVLDLCVWGCRDPHSFNWITSPPSRAIDSAIDTLQGLAAIRTDCSATETGRDLSRLGTHPRLGVMCVEARTCGLEQYAAALITLLEERIPSGRLHASVDISTLVEQLMEGRVSGGLTRLHDHYSRWLRRIKDLPRKPAQEHVRDLRPHAVGFLLARAFPERIAKRRAEAGGRYLLASGRGATLPINDQLKRSEYIVVAVQQDRTEDSLISFAAPVDMEIITGELGHLVESKRSASFDETKGVLVASDRLTLGALTLRETRRTDLVPDELREALELYLRTPQGFEQLPFSDSASALRARCSWARSLDGMFNLPDLSTAALCDTTANESGMFWLAAYLPRDGRLSSIKSEHVERALRDRFSWDSFQTLEQVAPESIQLPNGKPRRVDYSSFEGPIVRATIQELFGMQQTPLLGRERIPLTIHILSPARRPIQVTKDLASFWRSGYEEVRKELRGRYPKHKWPASPAREDNKK
jgi:ATP-dependent helicase HrpB